MKKLWAFGLIALLLLPQGAAAAKDDEEKGPWNPGTFTGLELREIGPAIASGRIGDFAVDPDDPATYYVAVCSGGVWKTTNAGTTWTPIFDDEGSYSIGCVTLDPNNPHVVWVGTGENNSQRSVSYGDGIYLSRDGGQSWKNMGLKESEHIAKIVIDPRDSDVIYVAAQGPLWRAGGDRGLYKSVDGGESWTLSLEISENTGVTDIAMDPRDPDVLYAASYQRRRHVWTLINGGPEGALYKSTDAGASWEKLTRGLPTGDVGRIGLALSPADPDVLYAIIEAAGDASGFYRSTDAGMSWTKRSDYLSSSPQYYQEIVADPLDVDRVYSNDTWMHVTHDGGATFENVPERAKHVDNHALWIDPRDTEHILAGCDGGIYETWDRGQTWDFKANLPVTQFYRATCDNDFPFYNVYGGTQDNATLGGPTRTLSDNGITNADWYVTVFGDGFKTQVDPTDPDIVYSQWQYGGLVRFDRKSGEIVDIQPQPKADDPPNRWNWDSPLILSPHDPHRLYYACQRVYRSDDRGQSWRAISGDLSKQIDRNALEVMGKVWSVDAVAKNRSTSFYGNIVSLDESPKVEGLLYAGTDDGLIQVSEDGGGVWRKVERVRGIPELSYVSDVMADLHDGDTVYAAFDNHKMGDFKPYLMRSRDRGRSWSSIAGDLPERGSVLTVAQDHVDPDLLFAGTEFGVFFSTDGGERWIQLKAGIPTIAVRDLDIQRRENDLVVGSFGRGFFILDDYSPLRDLSPRRLEQEAILFGVKKSWMYVQNSQPLGIPGIGFQGDSFYRAPNPPFGAIFTYYLEEGLQTREEKRQAAEKEAEAVAYPSWDELRAEDREESPTILLTVSDADGNVVRRLEGPVSAGFHRVAWNLRFPAPDPTDLNAGGPYAPWDQPPEGPMAVPGPYQVTLSKRVDGVESALAGPVHFETVPLGLATLATEDRGALLDFQRKTARLQRAVLGARRTLGEAENRLNHLKQAFHDTPEARPELGERARALLVQLADLRVELSGDRTVARRAEPTSPAIDDRVGRIVFGQWTSTSPPTKTHLDNYDIAARLFADWLPRLKQLVERDLVQLERQAEAVGAPWTPHRVPDWRME